MSACSGEQTLVFKSGRPFLAGAGTIRRAKETARREEW